MFNHLFFILVYFFLDVGDIKVISYNIRYDNPEDGVNVWENRKSTISIFLNNQKPELIGFQEVTHSQLLFLTDELSSYEFIGVGRDDGKTKGEYSPIFYNKNNFRLITENTFWLSQTPEKVSVGWDASMERICTYGLIEDKRSNKRIWVFNTHLDHIGKDARVRSIELILDTIEKLNEEDNPIILTGDFNLEDHTKPIVELQNIFNDVQEGISKSKKSYGTFNGFEKNLTQKKRIDYIFTKKLKIKKASHRLIKTPKMEWASDHHPVLAILKYQ